MRSKYTCLPLTTDLNIIGLSVYEIFVLVTDVNKNELEFHTCASQMIKSLQRDLLTSCEQSERLLKNVR